MACTHKHHQTKDYRWINKHDGSRCTWLETLKAACDHFGQFSGRWHDNDYWRTLRARSETMTEEEAERAVREYECEADCDLARWQAYQ